MSLFLHYGCEKLKCVSSDAEKPLSSEGSGVLGLLTRPLTTELVHEFLRTVIDPELGVNIVDLGLIYEIALEPEGNVKIVMTLTTPGCPLGGFLDDQIRSCLAQLPQVRDVSIELVWEPAWEPAAMSDSATDQLGWA